MKKSLIISALAFAASFGVNAETIHWDFASYGYFEYRSVDHGDPDDPFGYLPAIVKDGYDFIKNTGATTTEEEMLTYKDAEGKWHGKANRVISLMDGNTYCLTEDSECLNGVLPAELANQPFIGWGDKGPTRTRWQVGWGSLDAWEDKDYNGATEADWVATKNAMNFLRNGNSASRTDTYVQFPAVEGPCTVTVWCGSTEDTRSKNQNINVKITPVIDGVVAEDKAVVREKVSGSFELKRMYKMEPVQFEDGGKIAFRVGPNGHQLQLYHVMIETGTSGIEDIIANDVDENAPVYNVMGIQVDENYKGVVIKNGKKYIQR